MAVGTCSQPVFTDVDLSYTDHVISPTGITTETKQKRNKTKRNEIYCGMEHHNIQRIPG